MAGLARSRRGRTRFPRRLTYRFWSWAKRWFYTLALLRAYPFLQMQAAQLDALYPEWQELLQEELLLMLEQYEADARLIVVDDRFDYLCVVIASTLMAETGGDRKSPMYLRYFGEQPQIRGRRHWPMWSKRFWPRKHLVQRIVARCLPTSAKRKRTEIKDSLAIRSLIPPLGKRKDERHARLSRQVLRALEP